MHKNTYHAKTLIGNWQEERSTEKYEDTNDNYNADLPNPSYNKFVPISKDIGNNRDYLKVSLSHFSPFFHFFYNLLFLFRKNMTMHLKTG